jgi:hypothetical protein
MDWLQTDAQIGGLAAALGNCRRVSVQASYTLSGTVTPSGGNGTYFARIHVVRDGERCYGPAASNLDEISTLLDLPIRACNGQSPTRRIRYCTEYVKIPGSVSLSARTCLQTRSASAPAEWRAPHQEREPCSAATVPFVLQHARLECALAATGG